MDRVHYPPTPEVIMWNPFCAAQIIHTLTNVEVMRVRELIQHCGVDTETDVHPKGRCLSDLPTSSDEDGIRIKMHTNKSIVACEAGSSAKPHTTENMCHRNRCYPQ